MEKKIYIATSGESRLQKRGVVTADTPTTNQYGGRCRMVGACNNIQHTRRCNTFRLATRLEFEMRRIQK